MLFVCWESYTYLRHDQHMTHTEKRGKWIRRDDEPALLANVDVRIFVIIRYVYAIKTKQFLSLNVYNGNACVLKNAELIICICVPFDACFIIISSNWDAFNRWESTRNDDTWSICEQFSNSFTHFFSLFPKKSNKNRTKLIINSHLMSI